MNQMDLFEANKEERNPKAHYCFLDLETTGFDHKNDSIIEVAFILTDKDLNEISRFDQVITPHKSEITPVITRITGITPEEIENTGVSWDSVLEEIQNLIEDTIIVGHNIDFDIRFLLQNDIQIDPNKRIDTHELARLIFFGEESYSLEVLSAQYGFLHTDAHRALSDVEASIDLFALELQKIDELPEELNGKLLAVCNKHSGWFAVELLERSKQAGTLEPPKSEEKASLTSKTNQNPTSVIEAWSGSDHLWTQITDTSKAVDLIKQGAESGEKSVIVSPKLDFFPEYEGFPIPEILLDPQKLDAYTDQEDLSHGQVAFALKCLVRAHYGCTNVFSMDLFFEERTWWQDICVDSENHPLFQKEVEPLNEQSVLRISHSALCRFVNHPILQDRRIIVDEAEQFAESLLLEPTKTWSLRSYLEQEETSIPAHFLVKAVCEEIVEPLIGKKAGPFPERVALPSHKTYPQIAEILDDWEKDEDLQNIQDWCTNTDTNYIRWVVYYPDNGNVDFCLWEKSQWEALKQALADRKVWWLHRHTLHERNMFGWVFLGQKETTTHEVPEIYSVPELVIPDHLESAKSDAFGPFCTQFLLDLVHEKARKDHWIMAQSSSQESLKKWFEPVSAALEESDVSVLGERMSGGDGKLLQTLSTTEKTLLFTQKLQKPELAQYPIKTLVVQKFPFGPPHPLQKALEKELEDQMVSWWDVWTLPQLQAQLSRIIGQYPHAQEVYFLDTRENSGWGKGVLKNIFKK